MRRGFNATRNWSESAGQRDSVDQRGRRVHDGRQRHGQQYELARHFELTKSRRWSHGVAHHQVRRARSARRRPEQQSQGFNGSFSFLGGLAPVLMPQHDRDGSHGNRYRETDLDPAVHAQPATPAGRIHRDADPGAGRRPFAVFHPGRAVLYRHGALGCDVRLSRTTGGASEYHAEPGAALRGAER